jgi:hypothetical protein
VGTSKGKTPVGDLCVAWKTILNKYENNRVERPGAALDRDLGAKS